MIPLQVQSLMMNSTEDSTSLTRLCFPPMPRMFIIFEFARKHNIEISVKNSGHSYSGASSKKDTLLVNMNRFTHYAPGGITDCAALSDTAVADDLSNQACLLALARGKPGVIRVGGGENYGKSITLINFV